VIYCLQVMQSFEGAFFPTDGSAAREAEESTRQRSRFLDSYLSRVEDALSDAEQDQVENFLENVIRDNDGSVRNYNDITRDIFELNDPVMSGLQTRLAGRIPGSFRDYLVTQVDIRLGRISGFRNPDDSGVFCLADLGLEEEKRTANPFRLAEKRLIAERSEADRDDVESSDVEIRRTAVSEMNLESLLSKETIGSIEPAVNCQANYDFWIPDAGGFRSTARKNETSTEPRRVSRINEDQLVRGDVCFTFPKHRIRDGILPVPAGYEVIGSLDQDLELVDPGEHNPFCTRMLNDIAGDEIRYAVCAKTSRSKISTWDFMPMSGERRILGDVLPLPVEDKKFGETSIYSARHLVAKKMQESFLYICDDRIGAFIARHNDELGTIMDGLRAGHCDLLAWTAAVYFRQMGYAAAVVNTEFSGKEGNGFLKYAGHSRVGILGRDGSIQYFDPTQACRAVKGYSLSHVSDSQIAETERDFAAASTREQKIAALNNLRRSIDENEELKDESLYADNSIPNLDRDDGLFSGLMEKNKRVNEILTGQHHGFEHSPDREERIELNGMCDLLASYGCPLSHGVLMLLPPIYACPNIEASPNFEYLVKALNVQPDIFTHEKMFRALYPKVMDKIYSRIRFRVDPKNEELVKTDANLVSLIDSLPHRDDLMSFYKDFEPVDLLPGNGYPAYQVQEQARLYKLMAHACVDEEVREYLSVRFGTGEKELKDFATRFEPSLDSKTKPKKIAKAMMEFSGKTNKADYQVFCGLSESMHRQFTVDQKEYSLAATRFYTELLKLQLKPSGESDWQAERDVYDVNEVDYDPLWHNASQIDRQASERRGKLTVKIERKAESKQTPLHVYLDIAAEVDSDQFMSHYARLRVVLDSLIKFSAMKKVQVYITSGNNDYFLITPGSHPPVDLLLTRLLFYRIDRVDHGQYGFQTQAGLPKNLLWVCRQFLFSITHFHDII